MSNQAFNKLARYSHGNKNQVLAGCTTITARRCVGARINDSSWDFDRHKKTPPERGQSGAGGLLDLDQSVTFVLESLSQSREVFLSQHGVEH